MLLARGRQKRQRRRRTKRLQRTRRKRDSWSSCLGSPLKRSVVWLSFMTIFALFEVMDKEPSLIFIWMSAITLAVGGLLLSRYRWWLAAILIVIATLAAYTQITELRDPFVGPQIVKEAGNGYVIQSYIAVLISILLPSVGLIMKLRKGS